MLSGLFHAASLKLTSNITPEHPNVRGYEESFIHTNGNWLCSCSIKGSLDENMPVHFSPLK